MNRMILCLVMAAWAVPFLNGAEVAVFTGQPTIGGKTYLLAGWNFNEATAGRESQLAVSHGLGELTTNWDEANVTDFAGTLVGRFDADPAGRDLGLRNGVDSVNEGRYLQFTLDMTDFGGLAVSYATQRSNSGFTTHEWWWSLDGEVFLPAGSLEPGGSYALRTVDFSGMPELDDAGVVYFRLVLTGLPASPASTGNNRFDNIQFRATAINGTVSPGRAAVVNATPGSPFFGRPLFMPGETQSVAVVLSGNETGTAVIESFELAMPAGWSAADEVVLSGPGLAEAHVEAAGTVVVITGAGIGPGDSAIVELRGVFISAPFGLPESFGEFEITVETAEAGKERGPIAAKPAGWTLIPLEAIRAVDEGGQASALGKTVLVGGVATVNSGVFHNEEFSFFMQDETAGVAVFHPSMIEMGIEASAGNRYGVVGRVGQERGLTRIELSGPSDLLFLGAVGMPEPRVKTIAQLLAAPETLEGSLVRIVGITKTGGSWAMPGANGTVTVTDGAGILGLDLYLNRFTDLSWMAEPAYPVDVVGIFSQFKTAAPFIGGYQLWPRGAVDILPASEIPAGFDGWRQFFFPDELENSAISGAAADPDGDGVVNLLEYAFGGTPDENSRSLLPRATQVDGMLAITFWRSRDAEDLIYTVESSVDLENWTSLWSSVDHPYNSLDDVIEETVLDSSATEGDARRFLRLVVELD